MPSPSTATLIAGLRGPLTQSGLMTMECFNELVVKANFGHSACLKAVVAKGLGFAIVAGALLVKLPQVFKLLGSGSAEGLSFLGVFLELLAVTLNAGYSYNQGFPFSAYGEAIFLSLQTSLIAFLVLWLSGNTIGSVLFTAAFAGLAYALAQPGLVPEQWLWYGQAANIPMVVVGKLIQIITNFRNGHTGQLSVVTVFLLFAGSVARIFTSIQETGDQMLIMSFVVSTVANGILFLQVVMYWKATQKALQKKKVNEKKKRN